MMLVIMFIHTATRRDPSFSTENFQRHVRQQLFLTKCGRVRRRNKVRERLTLFKYGANWHSDYQQGVKTV